MTIPEDIAWDLEAVTDEYGLVQPHSGPPGTWASGNGILYTSIVVTQLFRLGALNEDYKRRYIRALDACEPIPGRIIRHPLNLDQEGPDDHVGAGAASYFLGMLLARRMLDRARREGFYFPVKGAEPWDIRAQLDRFPSLWCHVAFCDSETPPLLDKLVHAASIAFSPWKNEDEPTLSWLCLQVAESRSTLLQLASLNFRRRLKAKYPGGMAEVFSKTFGSAHPIARLQLLVDALPTAF